MIVNQAKLAALARLPLLSNLDESVLHDIAAHTEERAFSAGQLISLEGDPCPAILLIGQGVVQLRQFSQEGREHVLAYLSKGDCIHLAAVLQHRGSLANVQALSPVVLYALEAGYVVQLMQDHPRLAESAARYLASEVARLTDTVRDLALHSVRTRLARFLLAHAESSSRSDRDLAPNTWTQETIAARIGTVRDVVGRMLRAFVDEGLVRREQGRLLILDRARLQHEAQDEDVP